MLPEKAVHGMFDILPDDHKYFTFLKKVYRHEFRKNGYRRISTPLVEHTSLFERLYPEDDFITNSLYNLNNKDETALSLAPNPTAGIMRAYMDGGLASEIQPMYLYYIDKYFRKDGQDANQVYLIGGEIIGEKDPILDVLQIHINYNVLTKIGFAGKVELKINTLGNKKEMEKYIGELKNFYANKKHLLTQSGLKYLDSNPLLLLCSDNEDEKILALQAPTVIQFLKKDSKEYYEKVKEYLGILAIPYKEDYKLVSPFSYYNTSIWEISHSESNEVLVNGGRYDGLSKRMGYDDDIPATGFSARSDKLIAFLKASNISIRNKDKIDLYFVQLGNDAKKVVLPLSLEAREMGINTMSSLGTPSLKEQLLKAQRMGATFVVIVGMMEAKNGKFQVRNMIDGTQQEVVKEDLIHYIIEKIGRDKLDFYEPSRDLLGV